jgi:hypothetical protein
MVSSSGLRRSEVVLSLDLFNTLLACKGGLSCSVVSSGRLKMVERVRSARRSPCGRTLVCC